MAYLRKEKETVEIAYSLNKVWTAIPKVLASLQWNIEQIDETAHHVKVKTRPGLTSWSSVLLIDAVLVEGEKNKMRVSVVAETPVTTITVIVDFGRARRLIGLFFTELAEKLTG